MAEQALCSLLLFWIDFCRGFALFLFKEWQHRGTKVDTCSRFLGSTRFLLDAPKQSVSNVSEKRFSSGLGLIARFRCRSYGFCAE